MCGRYTLATPAELIGDHFDLPHVPQIEPRYNIAPTQEALIVAARGDGSRAAGLASWGLHARKSQGARATRRLINARVETVNEKPTFRDSFARRRCLVPTDGFFEWQPQPGGKVPMYLSLRVRTVFAFAGIWEPASDDSAPRFALLTTAPNALVQPIHSRMPVILPPETYDRYLAKGPLSGRLHERIAQPFPAESMQHWPVSTLVNSPANDSPRCIEPVVS